MSDKIDVNPTPIQRNLNDVATELTKQYYELHPNMAPEEIQETYAKFYAVAGVMSVTHYRVLGDFVPEKLKGLIEKLLTR